ncbi:Fpg/Nei family DNA glycosylase [Streptomyces lydicus]|uniref:Fpg/Nei family DNA glycosylase n=1 Tax=Streptomyces lydicus TaxID=47763 RepID=UPI0037A9750A
MPEGHTIHRLALDHRSRFEGERVRVSSPQGKFAAGAALVDGQVMTTAEAHGKHLFLGFGPPPRTSDEPPAPTPSDRGDPQHWIHVHLGLFGKLGFGAGTAPPPTETVRLRLATPDAHADLRGPTTCALITDAEKQAIHDRLGPDPLRPGDDPGLAWQRISRSRTTIAALLLDQKVIAGVGNVYRAEVLFRHSVDPYLPGRELTRDLWDALWADLVFLMGEGVRHNRIDTVRPEHLPEAMGRPPRVDDHGGEVYVYRRDRQGCHVCGAEIRTAGLAARNLFWCPGCQPATALR